jgi:DUF1680 family protein
MVEVNGTAVSLAQETAYPWDGAVKIDVNPAQAAPFALRVRIPGWARGVPVPSSLYHYMGDEGVPAPLGAKITVNGERAEIKLDRGYAVIDRTWQPGDVVEMVLSLPVRRVVSNEAIAENRGKVAVERGPLVYCLEGSDNGGKALGRTLPDAAVFTVAWEPDLLQGVNVLHTGDAGESLTFVPYYAWAHRGVGEMAVWLRR